MKFIRLEDDVHEMLTKCAKRDGRSATSFLNRYLRQNLTEDSIDWSKARKTKFPNLKPTTPEELAGLDIVLDEEEKELEAALERGEFQEAPDQEERKAEAQAAAKAYATNAELTKRVQHILGEPASSYRTRRERVSLQTEKILALLDQYILKK